MIKVQLVNHSVWYVAGHPASGLQSASSDEGGDDGGDDSSSPPSSLVISQFPDSLTERMTLKKAKVVSFIMHAAALKEAVWFFLESFLSSSH